MRNKDLAGFSCLRCETVYPVGDYAEGCSHCLADGYPVSVAAIYRSESIGHQAFGAGLPSAQLPYPSAPSLGEGQTPLLSLPRLSAEFGVASLHAKIEWANPTGSHKDRMSRQIVARALDVGAPLIVCASSGNAGISVAAYAAAASLPCEIVVTPALAPFYGHAIRAFGARLATAKDGPDRWRHVAQRVKEDGAFPATNYLTPPVGSHPIGVEGYKDIAIEILAQAKGDAPDVVVVPTARGDLLYGLFAGFQETASPVPRLVAVEPFPRLTRVLAGADYRSEFPGETRQFSTAGATVTYQAVHALTRSSGIAIAVPDEDALTAKLVLAREGLYAELSAAATLAGLREAIRTGVVGASSRVALILTSSGFRDAPSEPA